MSQLTLYHASPSRSSVVLWMLEELGVPYDIKLLSLQNGDNLKPDFLAINPMGKVPAIVHDGVAISEVAAICTYLADAFPDKKLNVPADVLAKEVAKGPYLLGDRFTAADILIGANIRWGTIFKLIPERKEFTDYVARFAGRPAALRAEAKDTEMAA